MEIISVIFVLIGLLAIYLYNIRSFDYWKKKGVKYVKPVLCFGSFKDVYLLRQSITQKLTEWYYAFPDEKVVGHFRSTTPGLLIRDPDLVKRILMTDFIHFYERGIHPNKAAIEPLLQNLFFAEGDLWRLLRQRMTPAFTSGKLKAMFPLIVERAVHLQARAMAAVRSGKVIDARDLMARYTTDFIGACGFGLDADSLNQEDSAFRKLGNEIFKFDLRMGIITFLKDIFPVMCKNFKYMGRIEKEALSLVYTIQKQRNFEPSSRNDFIDLMMHFKKKGIIKVESLENFNADGTPDLASLELTDQLIAAQAFVFFAAGFETSSSATSYTLHQLAFNPEVQKKAQEEIDAVLRKHDNKLSYDAIKDMTYLEWTFKEGMRMFPSLGYLSRKCSRKYTFPDLGITIDKGTLVAIPVQALQTDPKYFQNPMEFTPERFNPEISNEGNQFIYLPFGDGPRACIGARLGLMQSLAGLAAVLSRFTVSPAPGTSRTPPVEAKFDVVQSVDGGIPLVFKERVKIA